MKKKKVQLRERPAYVRVYTRIARLVGCIYPGNYRGGMAISGLSMKTIYTIASNRKKKISLVTYTGKLFEHSIEVFHALKKNVLKFVVREVANLLQCVYLD